MVADWGLVSDLSLAMYLGIIEFQARRLPEVAKKEVENLLTLGVRPDNIRVHLEQQDITVINKDIYNIKEKQKQALTKGDDEDLAAVLNSLTTDDPSASVHLRKSDDGTLEVLFFQTKGMREAAALYAQCP